MKYQHLLVLRARVHGVYVLANPDSITLAFGQLLYKVLSSLVEGGDIQICGALGDVELQLDVKVIVEVIILEVGDSEGLLLMLKGDAIGELNHWLI